VIQKGGERIGALAKGSLLERVGFDGFHEVAAGFEDVVEEFEFEVCKVAILAVFELMTKLVLVGAPATQGFEGDVESGFDEL